MNDVMQRIEDCLNEQGKKKIDLCRAISIGTGTLSTWKSKERIPSSEYLPAIAEYLGVTIDYLLTGSEPMGCQFVDINESVKVKVLGRVAAGTPIDMVEEVIGEESISMELAKTGEFFGLRISGDSMNPRMFSGDVVIVRQQEDVESGQIAIVAVNGEEATCKKVEKHSNGIMLVPLNKAYEERFYTNEEIMSLPVRILGRVMEVRGKL